MYVSNKISLKCEQELLDSDKIEDHIRKLQRNGVPIISVSSIEFSLFSLSEYSLDILFCSICSVDFWRKRWEFYAEAVSSWYSHTFSVFRLSRTTIREWPKWHERICSWRPTYCQRIWSITWKMTIQWTTSIEKSKARQSKSWMNYYSEPIRLIWWLIHLQDLWRAAKCIGRSHLRRFRKWFVDIQKPLVIGSAIATMIPFNSDASLDQQKIDTT